ncbi:hypothetical protein KJ359_008472 [Pestalotiopsis sp. 9143b]|nr:hypothetical protein KJ359_008472 [Pestalotiopsis sp. 9143b]
MDGLDRNHTTVEQAMTLEDGQINPLTHAKFSEEYFQLLAFRRALPVSQQRAEFLELYQNNQVVIVTGDTAAGKSTQIPQYVLFDEWESGKTIVCTEPRRLGAQEVAARVAEEMDVRLGGHEVGYAVRYDNTHSRLTRLLYTTNGTFLQKLKVSQLLSDVCCVIVDDAHERSVDMDMLLPLLAKAVSDHYDLKVVIMSATMDTSKFSSYFNNAPLMQIRNQPHELVIRYLEAPMPNYHVAAVSVIKKIQQDPEAASGDILVFLGGPSEIEGFSSLLEFCCPRISIISVRGPRFHGDDQLQVMAGSATQRRCIVTTNMSETSLTIGNIVYVIDSGLSRQSIYNPRTRAYVTQTGPISQASSRQRAGRAGRTQKGYCYRLYTKDFHDKYMAASNRPQIVTSNCTGTVLAVKSMGFDDVLSFNWLDYPTPEILLRSFGDLKDFGFLDDKLHLTAEGRSASRLPVDPLWAYTIKEGQKSDLACATEICGIAALCSTTRPIHLSPVAFKLAADEIHTQWSHPLSDHITLLNVLHQYDGVRQEVLKKKASDYGAHVDDNLDDLIEGELRRWCSTRFLDYVTLEEVVNTRDQLCDMFKSSSVVGRIRQLPFADPDYFDKIRRCLARGLFLQTAFHIRHDVYMIVHGNQKAVLDRDSTLAGARHKWVVWTDFLVHGTTTSYMKTLTMIEPEWIEDLAYFQKDRMSEQAILGGKYVRKFQREMLKSLWVARSKKTHIE